MPQNPEAARPPVIEVIDNLAPQALHVAAWATCSGKGWYFGHATRDSDEARFWRMDLQEDEAFEAIWQHARPRCEALAGGPLRVIRVYANGHTYGLGGSVHADDSRPGTFTLLYYVNPEWKQEWQGDTVYYDSDGEIALAVHVRPNRGVFFDSRIPHEGRPPARSCHDLRVTVAWKLERADSEPAPAESNPVAENKAAGAERTYTHRIAPQAVAAAMKERLEQLRKSVSLPGFRPGQAPMQKIAERYGASARQDVALRLATEAVEANTPKGSIVIDNRVSDEQSGALVVESRAIHLPDVSEPDFGPQLFVRLSASQATAEAAGLTREQAAASIALHLRTQLLDRLHAQYSFAVPKALTSREAEAIAKTVSGRPEEFAEVAERRARLGLLLAEFARRRGIRARSGPELESLVVRDLLASAKVEDREATVEELRELAAD
jgi:SM-20-related protein